MLPEENAPAVEPAAEPATPPTPPEPVAPDPGSEPTSRQSLERAFEKAGIEGDEIKEIEAPEPQDQGGQKKAKPTESKPDEDADGSGRRRDPETGKFVAKDASTEPPAEVPDKEASAVAKDESKAAKDEAAKTEGETKEGVAEPTEAEKKFAEPPARFTAEAKAVWKGAPPEIKAEIHRAVEEMESGIAQYREFVEPLTPFIELATKHGTTIPAVLERYIGLEQTLTSDPMRGLQQVFDYIKMSPHEFASRILGQEADPEIGKSDDMARRVRSEIQTLDSKLSKVQQDFSQTQEQLRIEAAEREVNAFKAAPGHERFDELSKDIATELKNGYGLQTAYDRAVKLNPKSAPSNAPAVPAQTPSQAPDPAAQTRKGSASVQGAPGPGSDPQKPSSTTRKALEKALASTGLS